MIIKGYLKDGMDANAISNHFTLENLEGVESSCIKLESLSTIITPLVRQMVRLWKVQTMYIDKDGYYFIPGPYRGIVNGRNYHYHIEKRTGDDKTVKYYVEGNFYAHEDMKQVISKLVQGAIVYPTLPLGTSFRILLKSLRFKFFGS
jgi:hypothetical protein